MLLGAFAGLRTAEVVGLRVVDVDFEDLAVCPVQQAGGVELKTAMSKAPVPIPAELAGELAASIKKFGGDYVVTDVRDAAAAIAVREGKTISQLTREALETRVAAAREGRVRT